MRRAGQSLGQSGRKTKAQARPKDSAAPDGDTLPDGRAKTAKVLLDAGPFVRAARKAERRLRDFDKRWRAAFERARSQ